MRNPLIYSVALTHFPVIAILKVHAGVPAFVATYVVIMNDIKKEKVSLCRISVYTW
jgi:hypothetical protein